MAGCRELVLVSSDRDPQVGWLSERRRGGISAALAIVAAVVLVGVAGAQGAADVAVVTLIPYLMFYLLTSLIAFGSADRQRLCVWARRESRGTFLQRYVLGTAPGPGTSLSIAAGSLIVAIVWLPRGSSEGFTQPARVALTVALIAVAWATVAVSFAIAYVGDDIEYRDTLAFPSTPEPAWSDYIYFAVAVMATLGTTDVQVASPLTRRTVTANTVVAFVFNTVIVATLVSALAAL